MHLTRVENSDTKRVSLFWHTLYLTIFERLINLNSVTTLWKLRDCRVDDECCKQSDEKLWNLCSNETTQNGNFSVTTR